MSHTSQRRGISPSRPGEEIIVLASLPKDFRKSEPARKAMSELAAIMLEHGRDHWPERTNDRFADVAKGSPPGTLAVAFTDPGRVESLLNDLEKEWKRGDFRAPLHAAFLVAARQVPPTA